MKRRKMEQVSLFSAPPPEREEAKPAVRGLTREAERLLANFEVLAEAPGGVKKLREVVLELAVLGRLLPQDPSDEPAQVLVGRIRARRAEIVKKDNASERHGGELPELPSSWQWCGLDFLLLFLRNGISTAPVGESGVPILRISAVRPNHLNLEDFRFLPGTIDDYIDYVLEAGDLLFTRYSGNAHFVGCCAVVPDVQCDVVHPDKLIRGKTIPALLEPRYVAIALNAGQSRRFIDQCARTTAGQVGISGKQLKATPVPLPPLPEQKRIVAKVDELMKLCDELEARQAKERETGARLTKAALDALANAEGPEDLAASWRRVVGNFEGLISRAEDVKKVREVVLELAVRGRLVAQVPSEGTVDSLFDMVQAKRARLNDKGIGARFKGEEELDCANAPFNIPAQWRWVSFAFVTICRDGQRIPVSKEERAGRTGPYDYYGASGVIDKIDNFIFDEPLLLVGEDGANLINRSTPIAFIAQGKYWVNNHAHVLDSANLDVLQYLEVYINAIDLKLYVTGTAQPKMNQAKMNSIPIALPPLPEQKRIVAKVDELMKLCDELEANMRQAEQTSQKVAEALVAELLS